MKCAAALAGALLDAPVADQATKAMDDSNALLDHLGPTGPPERRLLVWQPTCSPEQQSKDRVKVVCMPRVNLPPQQHPRNPMIVSILKGEGERKAGAGRGTRRRRSWKTCLGISFSTSLLGLLLLSPLQWYLRTTVAQRLAIDR